MTRRLESAARSYTPDEMMIAAAAREIRDGEMAFVGMRLPLLAFLVAQKTHAPAAIALFENGVVRERPPAAMLRTMGDPANVRGATFCGGMLDTMGFLQQGRVQVGLLGAAEVDRFGNVNTIWGERHGRARRLPGAGGGCDIACLARRTVVMIPHEREGLRERVSHLTSPGYGEGEDWRRREGLPANSGPGAIVTTLGVMRFGSDGEAQLSSVHPGVRMEDLLANTGWTLRVADELLETPPPSDEELAAIREFDPERFRTR
ncbi:MAG TPA: CoA-transferase [Candidatus Aquilonibacter sp.]|nr:CoA-transferase [Candidatus Aquilonibacter sp.]